MDFLKMIMAFFVAGLMLAPTGDAMSTVCGNGPAKYRVSIYNSIAKNGPCVSFEGREPPKSICSTSFQANNVQKTRCYTSYLPILPKCFPELPSGGIHFSPISVVTHSPRVSLFQPRGYSSKEVQDVCETGNNAGFLAAARALGNYTQSVKSGTGIFNANEKQTVEVQVTCNNSYLSAITMIAPSPDWIVQLANIPMLNAYGHYIEHRSGPLIAYDCGTDSGADFTAADVPTKPAMNIAPLFIDETDKIGKVASAWYTIDRI